MNSTIFGSFQYQFGRGLWEPLSLDHRLGNVTVWYHRSNSGANAGLEIRCRSCLKTMGARWWKDMREGLEREEMKRMLSWYNWENIDNAPKSVCPVAYMNAYMTHAAGYALSSTAAPSTDAMSTGSWQKPRVSFSVVNLRAMSLTLCG